MIKAFIRLALFIILPILLLIYVEPLSPVHMVEVHINKQYYVAAYEGTFFLLNRKLKEYPQDQWPKEFKKIASHFGYETQLISIGEASKKKGRREELLNDEFVYLDEKHQALMQRVKGSDWVIVMAMQFTDEENAKRGVSGPIYMLEQYFKEIPEEQWLIAVKKLQQKFGIGLALNRSADINLPDDKLDALANKRMISITQPDGEIFYYRMGQSDYILAAGPLPAGSQVMMIFGVTVILSIAISIALLFWLAPLWRDIKALDAHALEFGNGHLESRVTIKNNSIAARLGQSFNRMADSIQELISSNQELTNAVAHDLRTPLARLRFAVENMESENCSDEEKARYRRSVHSSVDSLDYLINQTLLHARYTRAADISHFSHYNLIDSITDEVEQCTYSDERIEFIFEPDERLKNTLQWVDPKALNRALTNLLSNAMRYASSKIRVSLILESDQLALIVEDDGPGMAPEDYEKVFKPFAQLGNEERDASCGHGLGLAIVGQIAKWHNGSVSINQSELGGARFKFMWPANIESRQ